MNDAIRKNGNPVAQSATVKSSKPFPPVVIRENVATIMLKSRNGFVHKLRVPKAALPFLQNLWPFEVGGGHGRRKIVRDGEDLSKVWADQQGIEVTKSAGLDWGKLVAPEIRKPAFVTRFDILQLFYEASRPPASSTAAIESSD